MSETVPGVYRLERPRAAILPLVLDSPHSGLDYPADFEVAVPLEMLRRAEDMYIEDLFGAAPARGAPILAALFPRSYIDPNRALRDLDRELLSEPWPEPVEPTEKARLGHGLIWRLCPPDLPMYARRLSVTEVRRRITGYWRVYHEALARVLDEVQGRFGKVWHINCHSMPSISLPKDHDGGGLRRAEFVLGDRDGTTCSREFVELVAATLRGFGYEVKLNDPYKGVEIVRLHGRPTAGRHSLQLEVNRALYMNEETFEPTPYYDTLKAHMTRLIEVTGGYGLGQLAAEAAE